MRYHRIPDETVRRLPVYLRGALHLSQQGVENVSSSELATMLGVNAWQIRKDFSYFGDFGTPGVGYELRQSGFGAAGVSGFCRVRIRHRRDLRCRQEEDRATQKRHPD